MFLTAYVALALFAALPLSMRRGGRPTLMFLYCLYRDFAYITAAVFAIIGFMTTQHWRFTGSAISANATGTGWWFLRGRLFLDSGIRRHHGFLVCCRDRLGGRSVCASIPRLAALIGADIHLLDGRRDDDRPEVHDRKDPAGEDQRDRLSPEVTAHLVDWFRFEDLFYVYLGFATVLGLYLTVRRFSAGAAKQPRG
jgi:hypothetical protein